MKRLKYLGFVFALTILAYAFVCEVKEIVGSNNSNNKNAVIVSVYTNNAWLPIRNIDVYTLDGMKYTYDGSDGTPIKEFLSAEKNNGKRFATKLKMADIVSHLNSIDTESLEFDEFFYSADAGSTTYFKVDSKTQEIFRLWTVGDNCYIPDNEDVLYIADKLGYNLKKYQN